MENDRFEIWWKNEGSGMRPLREEDLECFAGRITRIAWSNGEYVANEIRDNRIGELEAHVDLMIDEFRRIDNLTDDAEINGLCLRAAFNAKQIVPIVEQRDKALSKVQYLAAERDALVSQISEETVLKDKIIQDMAAALHNEGAGWEFGETEEESIDKLIQEFTDDAKRELEDPGA